MSVKIRLSRIGKKHVPFYRVVAVDSRKKRDGSCLEAIGTFDATKSTVVCFNEAAYQTRLSQGAIATDAVKKIYTLFKKGSAAQPEPVAKKAKPAKKTAAPKAAAEQVVEAPEQAGE
jgi:small subunit ribosomal protein S16